jgi:hypothetical protein
MRNPKNGAVRILRVKKSDDMQAIYAKIKRSFTAADLQRFTEDDESVPAREVVAKLKTLAKSPNRKRKT